MKSVVGVFLAVLLLSLVPGTARAGEAELSKELRAELERPEAGIHLAKAALLIAKEEYPALDVAVPLKTLDALGRRLAADLTKAGTVRERLAALKKLLFERERFGLPKADTASAFLLSEVLKNKRGNCLGLSVLCLVLGERAGLKLYGVPVPSRLSGPGHLLVRYDDGRTRINFDPTEGGRAHPDAYYKKFFKLRGEDLKGGYILGNARRKDVLNLLLVNLGGARVEAGQAARALPLLNEALRLKSDYAPAYLNLGAAQLRLGNTAEAAKAYRRALELEPGLLGARIGMAELALRRGAFDEAERDILMVLGEEPGNGPAKSLLANVHLGRGEFRAAIALLKEITQAAPKDLRARCNLGTAYRLAGQFGEAAQLFREVLAQDSEYADAHFGLGESLRAVGKTREARAAYERALKADPGHVPTRLAQGHAAQSARQWRQAEAAYEAVLKKEPFHGEALSGLVEVLIAQGKFKDAGKRLAAAVQAHPRDSRLALLLGEVKLRAGDYRGALHLLQQALAKAGEERKTPLLQRIAVCYGKLRNHRKAYETARTLLKTNPNDVVALRAAAAACEGFRNAPRAISYYRRILKVAPNDASARQALRRLGAR